MQNERHPIGVAGWWSDVPRQQLGHTIDRMIGDTLEHVAQIGLGIEAVQLCGFDQTVDCRCALAAGIRSGEQPILAAQGY